MTRIQEGLNQAGYWINLRTASSLTQSRTARYKHIWVFYTCCTNTHLPGLELLISSIAFYKRASTYLYSFSGSSMLIHIICNARSLHYSTTQAERALTHPVRSNGRN